MSAAVLILHVVCTSSSNSRVGVCALMKVRVYVCSSLKKETEQIEKGELDAELATMWEKVKA